jgi:protoheme IX farnesyltransferase
MSVHSFAPVPPAHPAPKSFRLLVAAAAIATFLLMVGGSAVRASGSALACPDWPTCYGQIGLPAGMEAQIQVAHRALAVLAGLLVWMAAGWALLQRNRQSRLVRFSLGAAAGTMLMESLVGGLRVIQAASIWPGPLHLGLAMLVFGLVLLAAVTVYVKQADANPGLRLKFQSPFARLSLWTLAGIFTLMLSGALVSALDAGAQCAGWPLCLGGLPQGGLGWLALGHRGVTLLVGALTLYQFYQAWRSQRSQALILPAVTSVFLLTLGQVLVGALKLERGFPADLVGLHAASAAALWGAQVFAVAAAGLAARSREDERDEAAEPLQALRRFKDFIMLSKPIIVLLLLVTTYAGLVVGGRKLPTLELTFWTLLGGGLAAAGASALNQYIDRETDKAMQRTQNRPLPGGRLKPAEALAYGISACLVAFFLLAGFVNLLAAVLSLLGMIYYVLLYSVWLKHATVQNIVIGGGAGAIPPLVGWAAATGSLDIPALFLFAIIFFWTPPHFWALALVRRHDYARGKVPMLPVVRGEAETRKQVFIYTLELVGLTLLMPLFKMAGSVYLVSALVLGAWLIFTAWRVLKLGGNKTAWTMYRTSSMYLMFLFIALVVDVLI